MVKPFTILPGILAIASFTLSPTAIAAEGGDWLDAETIQNWNTPGADVPPPPVQETTNFEQCERAIREPQVPQDVAVAAAGWQLYGPVQLYGDTTIVMGMANADGMCRPMVHQAFVFVGREFAGTLSPLPMDSRTDGNLYSVDLFNPSYLRGAYQRYAPTDAMCCPSSEDYLFFTIEQQDGFPVLMPEDVAA